MSSNHAKHLASPLSIASASAHEDSPYLLMSDVTTFSPGDEVVDPLGNADWEFRNGVYRLCSYQARQKAPANCTHCSYECSHFPESPDSLSRLSTPLSVEVIQATSSSEPKFEEQLAITKPSAYGFFDDNINDPVYKKRDLMAALEGKFFKNIDFEQSFVMSKERAVASSASTVAQGHLHCDGTPSLFDDLEAPLMFASNNKRIIQDASGNISGIGMCDPFLLLGQNTFTALPYEGSSAMDGDTVPGNPEQVASELERVRLEGELFNEYLENNPHVFDQYLFNENQVQESFFMQHDDIPGVVRHQVCSKAIDFCTKIVHGDFCMQLPEDNDDDYYAGPFPVDAYQGNRDDQDLEDEENSKENNEHSFCWISGPVPFECVQRQANHGFEEQERTELDKEFQDRYYDEPDSGAVFETPMKSVKLNVKPHILEYENTIVNNKITNEIEDTGEPLPFDHGPLSIKCNIRSPTPLAELGKRNILTKLFSDAQVVRLCRLRLQPNPPTYKEIKDLLGLSPDANENSLKTVFNRLRESGVAAKLAAKYAEEGDIYDTSPPRKRTTSKSAF